MDSFQDSLLFFEDFEGDSLKDIWNSALGGGGTGAVIDAQDGGIFRLGTPTASDSSTLNWNDVRSLHILKKVTIEARVRANNGVTDTGRNLCSLFFDNSNRVEFLHVTDGVDIFIRSLNGGATTSQDSGINIDADYHIYRIECFPTDEVHYYIDDVECANSPITTNIPSDAGDYMQPRFFTSSNADTDPATSMDIDYVYARQLR